MTRGDEVKNHPVVSAKPSQLWDGMERCRNICFLWQKTQPGSRYSVLVHPFFWWILWPIWDPKIPKIIMIVSLCIVLTRYFFEQVSQNSIRGTQVSAYHCYLLHIWRYIIVYIYIYIQCYIYTVYIHTLSIQTAYIIIHSPSISTAFADLLSKVMPGMPQSEVVMIASLTSRRLGLGKP